jgi:hypothetical protein
VDLFKKRRVAKLNITYNTHPPKSIFYEAQQSLTNHSSADHGFQCPRFSICIQFCQVYYLVFMFPQFGICLHTEKIGGFSIKNSIFAGGRAVMAFKFSKRH